MKRLLVSVILSICLIHAMATVIRIPLDYPTIQQGINNAAIGDTVLVQPGIYPENINFMGKNIVVASLFLTTNDTASIAATIISSPATSGINRSVVTFENYETNAAKLIGFTLKNGGGNYRLLGFDHVFYGGGIYCAHSSPSLSHLIITSNVAECGGGVFLYYSNSTLENCSISLNTCNSAASAAPNAGGAITLWNCPSLILRNNKIQNNTVERAGGAIYSLNSTCNFSNCLITGNHSMVMGSAFYADSWSNLKINNCTVSGNICNDSGPGIIGESMMYCLDSVKIKINNSIFYNNQPVTIVCQFNYGRNEITVFHSDFEGGADSIFTNNSGNNVTVNWLSGNTDIDPLFLDPGMNDFHLQSASTCINAGDTTGIPGIPAYDLDNNTRILDTIDMGCYEFQGAFAGINSFASDIPISVYPNPANSILFIENTSGNSQHFALTIYNALGSIVYSGNFEQGQPLIKISVSEFSNGMYFLHCSDEQKTIIRKFLVSHSSY